MLVATTLRDVLLVTWAVSPARVQHSLPPGLELELAPSGHALVSLMAVRNDGVLLDRVRAPSFSQLVVGTYVTLAGEPALFLLSVRVTVPALLGAFYGIPVRPARIRVRAGRVEAPGLGVVLRYLALGPCPAVPTVGGVELGRHGGTAFYSAGVRRIRGRRAVPSWREAELVEAPLVEPVVALGFDVGEPDSLLYADAIASVVVLPPVKVADSPS